MVADAIAAVAVIVIAANAFLGVYTLRTTIKFKAFASKQQKEAHEEGVKKMWDGGEQSVFTRNYLKERTVYGLIALGVGYTCVSCFVTRPLRLVTIVFDWKIFPGSEKLIFIMGSAVTAYGCGLFLTRTWRRFVRHKYYVELKNASWTSLLDPLRCAHSTTPRAASAPSHTEVMQQMTDLGGKKTKAMTLELPYTFWIKYKGVLTSEKSVILVSAAFGSFALLAAIATYDNYQLVRFVLGVLMPVYTVATLLLLRQVPECDSLLKLELTTHAVSLLVAFIFIIFFTAILSDWPKVVLIVNQIIAVIGNTIIIEASFRVIPQMVANKVADAEAPLSPMSTRARAKIYANNLLEALNDVQTFSRFMAHCCDEFCSENLLALLEMRAYKYKLRKEMIKEKRTVDEEKLKLERKSPKASPRGGATRMWTRPRKNTGTSQTKSGSEPPPIEEKKSGSEPPPIEEKMSASDEPILKEASGSGPHLTLEIVDSDDTSEMQVSETSNSGDSAVYKKSKGGKLGARLRGFTEPNVHTVEKLEHHQSVFTQAVEGSKFENIDIGLVGIQMSEWDIHWTLKLKALGVRSAIVSHKDLDWFQKAQALFAKYVAVDSPLQLNVSSKVRNKLELLVGPNSVVGDRLTRVHLLFLFDGAIAAVLANVFDTYIRFKRAN